MHGATIIINLPWFLGTRCRKTIQPFIYFTTPMIIAFLYIFFILFGVCVTKRLKRHVHLPCLVLWVVGRIYHFVLSHNFSHLDLDIMI